MKLISRRPYSLFYITGALVISILFYLTPYISIISFKAALENQDYEEAEKYIDFSAVRESLKNQIKTKLTKEITEKFTKSPLSIFGVVLINPVVNEIVNSTVTPSGLKLLLDQGKLSRSKPKFLASKKTKSNHSSYSKTNLYYESYSNFILTNKSEKFEDPIITLWKRERLIHWKLSSIKIPNDLIKLK